MKTIIENFNQTIKFFILGLFLWNCESEEIKVHELDYSHNKETIEFIINNNIKGIPFPTNSKLLKINNEQSKIVLTDDVFFVVKYVEGSKNGKVELISEMSVRCTCTEGSGCSPVSYDGNYYCVMNKGCKTCKMSTSDKEEDIEIVGIMDGRDPVKFISSVKNRFTTQERLSKSYPLNEDFFKNIEVQNQMNNLYMLVYGKNIPGFITDNTQILPKGYSYTKVDFYGNTLLIPISSQIADENEYIEIIDDSKVTCKCLIGISGCKLKSFLGAKYCEAGGCTDCILND